MLKATATISDGDTVIAQGVEAWVQSASSAGGAPGWRGRLALPPGVELPEDGSYTLVIGDGRAGRIRIDRVVSRTYQHTIVLFTGDGPFD